MARITKEDAHTLLHQYSEWVDGECFGALLDADTRTHDDLVDEFLRTRRAFALPVVEA